MIALGVEAFRLVHTPELDALRLTTPGALLAGRVVSRYNLPACRLAILAALGADHLTQRTHAHPRQSFSGQ